MEWAKVEYRCPLCKRRFSAISRQIEDRALATERIVSVPVGDQVCVGRNVDDNLDYSEVLTNNFRLKQFGGYPNFSTG